MLTRTILLVSALVAAALTACGADDDEAHERAGREAPAGETVATEGREIAFSREPEMDETAPDIWVMSADGSNQAALTDSPGAADEGPSWSPDAERIAFSRWEGKDSAIYVVNADGSGETKLTDDPGKRDLQPAFSPDGERIVFASDRDSPGDRVGGPTRVYVMSADGGDVTRLTNGPDDAQPAWSPDGQRIAFTRERESQDDPQVMRSEIWVMNADGGDQMKLSDAPELEDVNAYGPAFAPDGRQIAFLGIGERGHQRVIWVMSADGSDPSPLPNRPSTGLSFSAPAFSPDGERIAFVGDDEGPGIYVMNADGTNQAKLPGTVVNDTDPAWGPLPGAAGKDRKLAP